MIEPTRRPRRTVDTLAETVQDLIAPRRHAQRFQAGWRYTNRTGAVMSEHVTRQPSLIAQLRDAITDRAETQSGMRTGQVPVSTLPRFSVDAFDRMERIRFEVTEWLEYLGIPSVGARDARVAVTNLDVVEQILRNARMENARTAEALVILRAAAREITRAVEPGIVRLVEAAAELERDDLERLGADADRWRTWCRIMTGWELPAMRPNVACPECGATTAGERSGLRIRIEGASGTGGLRGDASTQGAVCLSCNRTWDADTVGLLAEQLRVERLTGPT